MKRKLISAAILSCCLLFTSCGEETSIVSELSNEPTSTFSSEKIESELIDTTAIDESTSVEEEEVEPTAITESIEIDPSSFFGGTSYREDVIDFSGVEMNILNILFKNKTINDVPTPVAQFSSSESRDAGCMTTT